MSNAMQWLKAKAPGFARLSADEQGAITDFSLLWSLFESRVLSSDANVKAICAAVEGWHQAGALDAAIYDGELAYFRNRYYAANDFTPHFFGLHLRGNDRAPLVKSVLDGTDADPCHRVSATLIIVFRYRNNLFHGLKWVDQLTDQLGNFNTANAVLMKVLDRHGLAMP